MRSLVRIAVLVLLFGLLVGTAIAMLSTDTGLAEKAVLLGLGVGLVALAQSARTRLG